MYYEAIGTGCQIDSGCQVQWMNIYYEAIKADRHWVLLFNLLIHTVNDYLSSGDKGTGCQIDTECHFWFID